MDMDARTSWLLGTRLLGSSSSSEERNINRCSILYAHRSYRPIPGI
jgi:hypothetical protein